MHFYSHTSTQKPTWPTELHSAKAGLKQRRELLNGETETDGTLLKKITEGNHKSFGVWAQTGHVQGAFNKSK